MRISDWSSDVCSSDLPERVLVVGAVVHLQRHLAGQRRCLQVVAVHVEHDVSEIVRVVERCKCAVDRLDRVARTGVGPRCGAAGAVVRSEEHTSELQSLMRISYAVFCLKKKKKTITEKSKTQEQ